MVFFGLLIVGLKKKSKYRKLGSRQILQIFFINLHGPYFFILKKKTWNICYKQIKVSLTKKQIPGPKEAWKTTDGGFWNTTKKMCCNVFFIKGTTRPIPQSMMCARSQMWFTRLHVSIMCTIVTTSRESQLWDLSRILALAKNTPARRPAKVIIFVSSCSSRMPANIHLL